MVLRGFDGSRLADEPIRKLCGRVGRGCQVRRLGAGTHLLAVFLNSLKMHKLQGCRMKACSRYPP